MIIEASLLGLAVLFNDLCCLPTSLSSVVRDTFIYFLEAKNPSCFGFLWCIQIAIM